MALGLPKPNLIGLLASWNQGELDHLPHWILGCVVRVAVVLTV